MNNTNIQLIETTPDAVNAPSAPPSEHPGDAEVDVEVLRQVPKAFCIQDQNSANWLVRKVMASRQYGQDVKRWAELEMRRAEREEACLMYLFGRQIERWAREEIGKLGGRRKSISLPAGTVAFRKVNAHLVVEDEARLMAWARDNCPTAIQVTERLAKTPINELFTETGELPEGARLEREREVFRIS
jgi:hypothetical protein